jgi:hypothetical protein
MCDSLFNAIYSCRIMHDDHVQFGNANGFLDLASLNCTRHIASHAFKISSRSITRKIQFVGYISDMHHHVGLLYGRRCYVGLL